ncbi:hypothetical protein K461DRAFT_81945 [Myriangium duriaei CBS 260.36]|uniref:Uncharacterized protein n=1 Tax=Myriangium duriaei CBS 260.36 TaxID=1168546 RepID=A0A9P4J9X4_9PEZI|nr:hypothetical protein K461DRAFT_81945 [Myriangium duriaei CBS 260.36]
MEQRHPQAQACGAFLRKLKGRTAETEPFRCDAGQPSRLRGSRLPVARRRRPTAALTCWYWCLLCRSHHCEQIRSVWTQPALLTRVFYGATQTVTSCLGNAVRERRLPHSRLPLSTAGACSIELCGRIPRHKFYTSIIVDETSTNHVSLRPSSR